MWRAERPSRARRSRLVASGLALAAIIAALGACGARRDETPGGGPALVVFVAASTADVVDELARRFEALHSVTVHVNAAASSTLARQIEAGAAADLFISADERWMDALERRGLMRAGTRRDLLGNVLVIIAPDHGDLEIDLDSPDAPQRLGDLRLAVADPEHVPAGRYAMQALEALGWEETLHGRLIPAIDVRAALHLVELREADAGIVYATDAAASRRVRIVRRLDETLHEPIRYPVALPTGAGPGAAAFLEFISSPEAADVFASAGFRRIGPAP
jgi:molybdate transport system substrate-binding protein